MGLPINMSSFLFYKNLNSGEYMGHPSTMGKTPLSKWDDDYSDKDPYLVWYIQLDNRYLVEVQRIGVILGLLCIFDHNNNDTLIFQEEVPLSFGAVFGPDVNDVEIWKDKIIEYIDSNTWERK